jgi:GNAT superfamily N-acetyltransferase
MTTVSILPATPADLADLVALIADMEAFYGEVEPTEVAARNTERALFSETPYAHVLLARVDHRLAAFASYSFLWPASGTTGSLYLKELYVRSDDRRLGIGRQLMDELSKIAAVHQCSRVEWTTDTDNTGTQQFYADLGHHPHTGKLLYRIDLT